MNLQTQRGLVLLAGLVLRTHVYTVTSDLGGMVSSIHNTVNNEVHRT